MHAFFGVELANDLVFLEESGVAQVGEGEKVTPVVGEGYDNGSRKVREYLLAKAFVILAERHRADEVEVLGYVVKRLTEFGPNIVKEDMDYGGKALRWFPCAKLLQRGYGHLLEP